MCGVRGAQCGFVKKMYLLNPLTTRQFTAYKLGDSSDAGCEAEPSHRWLTLAVSAPCRPTARAAVEGAVAPAAGCMPCGMPAALPARPAIIAVFSHTCFLMECAPGCRGPWG